MQFGTVEFKPSLVPTIIFLIVLPILLSLGNWQMNRASDKKALDDDRAMKSQVEVLNLNLTDEIVAADRYRKATVKGQYWNNRFWLQDNQVSEKQAGYHVYSLLKLESIEDKFILINRGWVPVGMDRKVLPDIVIPDGVQELQGRLDTAASVGVKLGEPAYDLDKVVLYIDIDDFAKTLSLPVIQFALMLDKGEEGVYRYDWEQGAQMTPTKHVGYAFQWFALATALIIIYIGVNTHRLKSEDK